MFLSLTVRPMSRSIMASLLLAAMSFSATDRSVAQAYILGVNNADWSNPKSWANNDTTIPGNTNQVFVRNGHRVGIYADVGSIRSFLTGEVGQDGSIYILPGGKLVTLDNTIGGRSAVGRPLSGGSVGHLYLNGGLLQVGNAGGEVLNIGVDTATAQATGTLTISGGAFNGRLLVGSAIQTDSGDTVRIVGNIASIGASTSAGIALEVRASGAVEFVFGADGISTMDYGNVATGATVSFASGSRVLVDGANYRGDARTFTLINAKSLGSTRPSITLTNFAAGATHHWGTNTATLTITTSGPSPDTGSDTLLRTVHLYGLVPSNFDNSASINEMMASLAGLANRYYPGELLPDGAADWLDRLRSQYPDVQASLSHAIDWVGSINRYRSIFNGYILYDKNANAESLDVASSLAGLENALIVDPTTVSYAISAGLPMILDVRDKSQAWAWTNYSSQFSRNLMFHLGNSAGRLTGHWLRDHAIMNKGFCFYLPTDMGRYLGSQDKAGSLYGFGSEFDFFNAASTKNQQAVVSDFMSGTPATSGWNIPIRPQRVHAPLAGVPANNKHYVAFVASDGDNIAHLQKSFVSNGRLFASPLRGKFKMTWDMSPEFGKVNSFGVNYIYGLAEGDAVVCSGGRGLIFPSRVPDLNTVASDVGVAMRSVDHNIISILDPSSDMSKSAALVEHPQIIGAMYKTYSSAYKGLGGAVHWTGGGKPIVSVRYSLWDGFDTPASITAALNAAPRLPYTSTASYSIVNVHPWSTNHEPMAAVDTIVSQLDPDVEVVNLEELLIYLRNGYGVQHGHSPARTIFYWDRNGTAPGPGTSPSGSWGSSSVCWGSDPAGTSATVKWPTNAVAAFPAGHETNSSYSVTVDGTHWVTGLEFPNGSVTLSGGAIDITGDTIINVSAGTHVIDSKIQGVGNLIKTGPGVLVLSHPENTFTGLLDVAAGTVRVTGTITEPKGIEIKSGATLENRGLVGASVNVASGGTYEGGGEVAGDLLSQGMLRVTAGEVLRVAGRIVSDGALDIMTGAQELPPNLVHNGVILDRSLLKIASLSKIADGYSVTMNGYSGHRYQLQRTESLSGPWANVGASQAGTSHGLTTPTLLTFSDPSPPERQCFYRVVVSP